MNLTQAAVLPAATLIKPAGLAAPRARPTQRAFGHTLPIAGRRHVVTFATPADPSKKGKKAPEPSPSETVDLPPSATPAGAAIPPTVAPTPTPASQTPPPALAAAATNPTAPAPPPAATNRPTSVYIDAPSGAAGKPLEVSTDTQGQASQAADEVATQVEDVADDAAKAAKEGIDQAADAVEDVADQAADVVKEGADQLSSTAQQAAGAAQDVAGQVQNTFEEISNQFSKPRPPLAFRPLTNMSAIVDDGSDGNKIEYLKKRLLATVAGLDRGFVATSNEAAVVEAAATALVDAAGGSGKITWYGGDGAESQLSMLAGAWRLVYSSNFRPKGASGRNSSPSPFILGQVYQVINPTAGTLDNVVELESKLNLPSLPIGPKVEPARVTATLKHRFSAYDKNKVEITFINTDVLAFGGIGGILNNLPVFTLPSIPQGLQPSGRFNTFDVLFLDKELRVSRGSRGELRVFIKSSA